MNRPVSFFDRVGYGGVMLFFGTAVGFVAGLAGLAVSEPPHFNLAALIVTLAAFFAIGFAFLDRGADFLAVCAISFLIPFSVATQTAFYEPTREEFSPKWCLLALIAWLSAVGIALFNS